MSLGFWVASPQEQAPCEPVRFRDEGKCPLIPLHYPPCEAALSGERFHLATNPVAAGTFEHFEKDASKIFNPFRIQTGDDPAFSGSMLQGSGDTKENSLCKIECAVLSKSPNFTRAWLCVYVHLCKANRSFFKNLEEKTRQTHEPECII